MKQCEYLSSTGSVWIHAIHPADIWARKDQIIHTVNILLTSHVNKYIALPEPTTLPNEGSAFDRNWQI